MFRRLRLDSRAALRRTWPRAVRWMTGGGSAGRKLSSNRARQLFIDFFVKEKSHQFVPSSSVLPRDDSTLLFTNAGMNQFKSLLLGSSSPHDPLADLRRAANSQKCVRVGGKHNDLEDVGRDGHHHTFFEMLGNWSFGDYFKKEACEMAWELLTGPYGLPPEKLFITYFGGNAELGLEPDIECKEIWLKIGVPADHILPLGMKDNFWDMGDTGPCGPCTEIHYSHGPYSKGQHLVNAGVADAIELWNIVFIQYSRQPNGILQKLRKHHVDTGMGLERLMAVLHGSTSNYDTDLFTPSFDVIQKETKCRPYRGDFGSADLDKVDAAYRILADHARMCAVCISDGLLPAEVDAGHCLRKVIRRSAVAAKLTLNSPPGLLSKLIPCVVDSLGTAFPEMNGNTSKIIGVVQEEENRFLGQFEKGLPHLRAMVKRTTGNIFPASHEACIWTLCFSEDDINEFVDVLPATSMWELCYSHCIPEDVIPELVLAEGLIPDVEGFKLLQAAEKEKTQSAHQLHQAEKLRKTACFDQTSSQKLIERKVPVTDDSHKYEFSFSSDGIDIPSISSQIVALWDGDHFVDEIQPNTNAALVTQKTNFYAEAGGQDSDVGFIETQNGAHFRVENVSNVMGYIVHQGVLVSGTLKVDELATLSVDHPHREGCTRNHTATHLLQAALRRILGPSMAQRSSHVAGDYLRFDFPSKTSLSKEQLQETELFLRNAIKEKIPVQRRITSFDEVKMLPNLVTVPGEVYPPTVSLITISVTEGAAALSSSAVSLELCCGTHVPNTAEIQDFVIFSQKPQAQTVRSIHAVTGKFASRARQTAAGIAQEIPVFEAQIRDMEDRLSRGGNVDVENLYLKLGVKRVLVAEGRLPLLCRDLLDKQLENLRRKLGKFMKMMVKREIQELLRGSPDSRFYVYQLETAGDDQVILSEATKQMNQVPHLIFSSYKDVFSCRCFVPEELATDAFDAEKWAKHVLNSFPGYGKPLRKDPCTYFALKIPKSENVAAIIETSRQYLNQFFPD